MQLRGMTDSIISALRERLRKTGASQAEIDALEELVAAREELVKALELALPYIDNDCPPGGCDGTYADQCPHCRVIALSRAALSKHKPAE